VIAKFDFKYVGHKVDYTKEEEEPVVSLVFKPRGLTKGSFVFKGPESEMFEILSKLKIKAEAKNFPVQLVLQVVQETL
jgi:hypothetical protein